MGSELAPLRESHLGRVDGGINVFLKRFVDFTDLQSVVRVEQFEFLPLISSDKLFVGVLVQEACPERLGTTYFVVDEQSCLYYVALHLELARRLLPLHFGASDRSENTQMRYT